METDAQRCSLARLALARRDEHLPPYKGLAAEMCIRDRGRGAAAMAACSSSSYASSLCSGVSSRTFASRYANTYAALQGGGFALVVRSRADQLSRSIGPVSYTHLVLDAPYD